VRYIKDAEYVADYTIEVRFDNDDVRLVDLAPHLDGPIFEPLKETSCFRSFVVNPDLDTVVWPNGADFAPEFLYEIGQPMNSALRARLPRPARQRG